MKKFIALIPVLIILFACNSVQKMQSEWITSFLPEQLWEDITLEAINDEYERITDEFVEMGNDAITAFNEKGEEEDLNTLRSAYFWGLGDLYQLGGGNSDKVKQREAIVEKYKAHFTRVTELFRDAMASCLCYRDSSLSSTRVPSDEELFAIMYGTPERISTIDESGVYQYARMITIHEIAELERPVIASYEYDKERDLWIVRLDNMEDQYVKFFERNDGDYDMEYSSKLNADGTPKTDSKVTITFEENNSRNHSSPKNESSASNQKNGKDASGTVSGTQSNKELSDRTLELCQYIPDHILKPEAKQAMTPEFFLALSEAFDAPVPDYGMIGEDEWLAYFVTGNGGSEPVYSVKSVSLISKDTAKAVIIVRQRWEDNTIEENSAKDYEVWLKLVDGKWLLDDFDGKKAECRSYVQEVREKYASGEYIKYLKSDEELKEYVPDFQKRINDFYAKYGK